jgi:hypothetical protein
MRHVTVGRWRGLGVHWSRRKHIQAQLGPDEKGAIDTAVRHVVGDDKGFRGATNSRVRPRACCQMLQCTPVNYYNSCTLPRVVFIGQELYMMAWWRFIETGLLN